MWKFLKAELAYNKNTLIFSFTLFLILVLLIFGYAWKNADEDANGMLSILASLSIILWVIQFFLSMKENKIRFIMSLPSKPVHYSATRLLFGLIVWFGFIILYLAGLLILRYDEWEGWILTLLVTSSGMWMMANALPFIHSDLLKILKQKYRILILSALYTFALLFISLFFSITAIERYFLQGLPESFLSVLIYAFTIRGVLSDSGLLNIALGIILSLLSIWLFSKRKSYLE